MLKYIIFVTNIFEYIRHALMHSMQCIVFQLMSAYYLHLSIHNIVFTRWDMVNIGALSAWCMFTSILVYMYLACSVLYVLCIVCLMYPFEYTHMTVGLQLGGWWRPPGSRILGSSSVRVASTNSCVICHLSDISFVFLPFCQIYFSFSFNRISKLTTPGLLEIMTMKWTASIWWWWCCCWWWRQWLR